MNASAGGKGLIYNSLQKVKVITPEGEIKELSKKECNLRSRGSLLQDKKYFVIEATFNLIKDDKMKIQKAMADHTFIYKNFLIIKQKILVLDILDNQCIFLVQDVSLFG